ncbi:MAG TPA: VF_A0006 family four-cysteine protein [Pseudomonas sp.]|nr:VF_A0006 family four-cysteine protein [Pseudomonas sp.]
MGKRLSSLLLLMLAGSSQTPASDNEAYNACVLKYQALAKTERAAFYIQRSCSKLHIDGNYLFGSEKKYHQCILDNLPGVETETATSRILSVCNDQSSD